MNRYLTTTLPYVNADPHIGFALEIVQADALARTWRMSGDDVFFTTGTDEHGQKIAQAAEKEGKDVQEYVDHYADQFEKLKNALGLSYDAFIRTTEPRHIAAAQDLWTRCTAAGDIYKKAYTGLYCVGDEMFMRETDLVDGRCPNHPNQDLVEITEENYFFKFSAYQEKLLKYLSREDCIVPDWRRLEAIKFVEGGLEDFSISREKARMSWGVPVPSDDSQVMYVWFDALTNYISTLGWPEDTEGNFKKFWTDGFTLQVGGKDQVRFQSLMWQAMLMSADIKNTDQVFYHGFITSAGQKMSKSVGNVISPYDLVEKYGTDATRYMLIRHIHPTEDTDVTWERLDEWYTANMVNGLGNLVARVMKLAEDNLDAPVEGSTEIHSEFLNRLNALHFNEALDYVFEMIAECDGVMTERAPFKKVKSEDDGIREEGKGDIGLLVGHLVTIASHLAPIMPKTSEAILAAVRENKKPENLFPRLA
jgi:methionyl-tRNA synthetase